MNRLREAALITECTDPSDKQAKLLKHTAKGEEMLFEYCHHLHSIESLPFGELAEEDKKLCIQLLKNGEIKRTKLVLEVKHSSLDDILKM